MNLPMIDLASLPALDIQTGLYGSQLDPSFGIDDRMIVILVYVYDSNIGPSTH